MSKNSNNIAILETQLEAVVLTISKNNKTSDEISLVDPLLKTSLILYHKSMLDIIKALNSLIKLAAIGATIPAEKFTKRSEVNSKIDDIFSVINSFLLVLEINFDLPGELDITNLEKTLKDIEAIPTYRRTDAQKGLVNFTNAKKLIANIQDSLKNPKSISENIIAHLVDTFKIKDAVDEAIFKSLDEDIKIAEATSCFSKVIDQTYTDNQDFFQDNDSTFNPSSVEGLHLQDFMKISALCISKELVIQLFKVIKDSGYDLKLWVIDKCKDKLHKALEESFPENKFIKKLFVKLAADKADITLTKILDLAIDSIFSPICNSIDKDITSIKEKDNLLIGMKDNGFNISIIDEHPDFANERIIEDAKGFFQSCGKFFSSMCKPSDCCGKSAVIENAHEDLEHKDVNCCGKDACC